MSEADDLPGAPGIALEFLKRYAADQAAGRPRSLEGYLAMFPGFEDEVVKEFGHLKDEAVSDPTAPREVVGARLGPDFVLGPYHIIEELGRGSQGIVYLAEDERLTRKVALKVLHGRASFTREASLRFRREAEATARLDHPGICRIWEVGSQGGTPYIAMQFVEGRTLSDLMSEPDGEKMPSEELFSIVEKVARALHVAHESGVVHRDVKPANIVIAPDGEPVILDFGLARDDSGASTLTAAGAALGSPAYMSPEQVDGSVELDPRTDLWSLGVVLFEGLTARRPFEAPTRVAIYNAVKSKEPPDPRRLRDGLSSDATAILQHALEKNPDRRYESARAFADDLCAMREGRPVSMRPIRPWGRLYRWQRREPVRAGPALAPPHRPSGLRLPSGSLPFRTSRPTSAEGSRIVTGARGRAVGRILRAERVRRHDGSRTLRDSARASRRIGRGGRGSGPGLARSRETRRIGPGSRPARRYPCRPSRHRRLAP